MLKVKRTAKLINKIHICLLISRIYPLDFDESMFEGERLNGPNLMLSNMVLH